MSLTPFAVMDLAFGRVAIRTGAFMTLQRGGRGRTREGTLFHSDHAFPTCSTASDVSDEQVGLRALSFAHQSKKIEAEKPQEEHLWRKKLGPQAPQ